MAAGISRPRLRFSVSSGIKLYVMALLFIAQLYAEDLIKALIIASFAKKQIVYKKPPLWAFIRFELNLKKALIQPLLISPLLPGNRAATKNSAIIFLENLSEADICNMRLLTHHQIAERLQYNNLTYIYEGIICHR